MTSNIVCNRDSLNLFMRRLQSSKNNEVFGIKDPHDKIKCIICGGSYSRQSKSIHCKSKKHQLREFQIHEEFNNLFSKNI